MAIATIGSRLTYTIVVQNTGTLPAQNVTFTDPTRWHYFRSKQRYS